MIQDGWTRYEIEDLLGTAEPDELAHVPIVISLDPPDSSWAEEICLERVIEELAGRICLGHIEQRELDIAEPPCVANESGTPLQTSGSASTATHPATAASRPPRRAPHASAGSTRKA